MNDVITEQPIVVPQDQQEAWQLARLGCATASRVADIVARTKSGWGASRRNYAAELVCERLTLLPTVSYMNADMQRGMLMEPQARNVYEFFANAEVQAAGFMKHPTIDRSGATPDGFVGTDGLVEIKCPKTANHIDTLLGGSVDGRYVLQMQWQMAVTGRAWCDFVSYDDRMPEAMRLFVRRVHRDEATISDLSAEIVTFLNEIAATVEQLQAKYGTAA